MRRLEAALVERRASAGRPPGAGCQPRGPARRDRRARRAARSGPHGDGAHRLRGRRPRGARSGRWQAVVFAEPAEPSAPGSASARRTARSRASCPTCRVRENLTLAAAAAPTRPASSTRRSSARSSTRFIKRLGIKAAWPEQTIRELSGGNQQKVLLARWLCMDPKLLILDEPTRGIDVGAKAEILRLIRALADEGLRRPDDLLRARGGDRGQRTASSCFATGAPSAELTRQDSARTRHARDGARRCVRDCERVLTCVAGFNPRLGRGRGSLHSDRPLRRRSIALVAADPFQRCLHAAISSPGRR